MPLERDQCVEFALRAWLDTIAPSTISEINARLGSLGRPAKNLVARAGGIREFLGRCPHLYLDGDRVEILFNNSRSSLEKLRPRDAASHLNQLSKDDIALLNKNSTQFKIEAKSGRMVNVLQKRHQLDELRRQCEMKKACLEALRARMRSESSGSVAVAQRLEELKSRREVLLKQLSQAEVVFEEESKLERELSKMDNDIESTEDTHERLKLKIVYSKERLTMFEKDLFFETQYHESLTDELLKQRSADLEKIATVLEVLLSEKCAHCKTVLRWHIKALENAKSDETPTMLNYRQKLAEVELKETELLCRVQEHRATLRMISQVDLPTIDLRNSPLFVNKLTVAQTFDEQENSSRATVGGTEEHDDEQGRHGSNCAICLNDLNSEVSETLECAHSFHSSCLGRMYLFGTVLCPLCRRYEPSSSEFPPLR